MPNIKKKDIECPRCGDHVRVRVLKETIGDARWDDLCERFVPDTDEYFHDGIKGEPIITSKVIECRKCGGRWVDDDMAFMGAMQRGKEKRENREKVGDHCALIDAACPYYDDEYTYCSECVQRKADDKELERRREEETKTICFDTAPIELFFLDINRQNIFNEGATWGTKSEGAIYGTTPELLNAIYQNNSCTCASHDGEIEYYYIEGGSGRFNEYGKACGECFGLLTRDKVEP